MPSAISQTRTKSRTKVSSQRRLWPGKWSQVLWWMWTFELWLPQPQTGNEENQSFSIPEDEDQNWIFIFSDLQAVFSALQSHCSPEHHDKEFSYSTAEQLTDYTLEGCSAEDCVSLQDSVNRLHSSNREQHIDCLHHCCHSSPFIPSQTVDWCPSNLDLFHCWHKSHLHPSFSIIILQLAHSLIFAGNHRTHTHTLMHSLCSTHRHTCKCITICPNFSNNHRLTCNYLMTIFGDLIGLFLPKAHLKVRLVFPWLSTKAPAMMDQTWTRDPCDPKQDKQQSGWKRSLRAC